MRIRFNYTQSWASVHPTEQLPGIAVLNGVAVYPRENPRFNFLRGYVGDPHSKTQTREGWIDLLPGETLQMNGKYFHCPLPEQGCAENFETFREAIHEERHPSRWLIVGEEFTPTKKMYWAVPMSPFRTGWCVDCKFAFFCKFAAEDLKLTGRVIDPRRTVLHGDYAELGF